jgi:hypothetical protein
MGLIREPKHIDFSTRSSEWSAKDLEDFRKLMQQLKAKNKKNIVRYSSKRHKKITE